MTQNTHNKNHRKLILIMTLKQRIEREQFNIRNAGKFCFPQTAPKHKARAEAALAIYQGRLEKLRANTEIDFIIK